MIDLVRDSARRFLAGKMFRDNRKVVRQVVAASSAGALVLILASLIAPFWVASILGGATAGALQPYLLRNVKYA